jgi:hypothetical protein
MKYTIVKQFSNAAIDNIYNFVFKIVDFFKIMYEAMWALLEVFISFFLIFYNMFMYIYYLFLFMVDRGAETGEPILFRRAIPKRQSYLPKVTLSSGPNPIPAMYGGVKERAAGAATAAAGAVNAVKDMAAPTGTSGVKRSVIKSMGESIVQFLISLKESIKKPVVIIAEFFQNKLKPVKEGEKEEKGKSLIDEYLREYEKKRK